MKRLISAKDVEDAAAKGESLLVDDNTIVTAQARDIARERGVLLQCAHEVAAEPAPAKAAEPAQPCRGAMSEQAATPAQACAAEHSACCDHREPALRRWRRSSARPSTAASGPSRSSPAC